MSKPRIAQNNTTTKQNTTYDYKMYNDQLKDSSKKSQLQPEYPKISHQIAQSIHPARPGAQNLSQTVSTHKSSQSHSQITTPTKSQKFAENITSIIDPRLPISKELLSITWKRPAELYRSSGYSLFCEMNPKNICQGALKDSNFLVGVSLLLEIDPSLVTRLFEEDGINRIGVYRIWLFFEGLWTQVEVEDVFPAIRAPAVPRSPSIKARNRPSHWEKGLQKFKSIFEFAFSRSLKHGIWLLILQKGLAQLLGTYKDIEKLSLNQVLRILTGSPFEVIKKLKRDQKFKKWRKMVKGVNNKHLIFAQTGPEFQKFTNILKDFFDKNSHTFRILDAVDLVDINGNFNQLVKVSDPGKYLKKDFELKKMIFHPKKFPKSFGENGNLPFHIDFSRFEPGESHFWTFYQNLAQFDLKVSMFKISPELKFSSLELPGRRAEAPETRMIKVRVLNEAVYSISFDQKNLSKMASNRYIRLSFGKIEHERIFFINSILSDKNAIFFEHNLPKGDYLVFLTVYQEPEEFYSPRLTVSGRFAAQLIDLSGPTPHQHQTVIDKFQYQSWKNLAERRTLEFKFGKRELLKIKKISLVEWVFEHRESKTTLLRYCSDAEKSSLHWRFNLKGLENSQILTQNRLADGAKEMIIRPFQFEILVIMDDPRKYNKQCFLEFQDVGSSLSSPTERLEGHEMHQGQDFLKADLLAQLAELEGKSMVGAGHLNVSSSVDGSAAFWAETSGRSSRNGDESRRIQHERGKSQISVGDGSRAGVGVGKEEARRAKSRSIGLPASMISKEKLGCCSLTNMLKLNQMAELERMTRVNYKINKRVDGGGEGAGGLKIAKKLKVRNKIMINPRKTKEVDEEVKGAGRSKKQARRVDRGGHKVERGGNVLDFRFKRKFEKSVVRKALRSPVNNRACLDGFSSMRKPLNQAMSPKIGLAAKKDNSTFDEFYSKIKGLKLKDRVVHEEDQGESIDPENIDPNIQIRPKDLYKNRPKFSSKSYGRLRNTPNLHLGNLKIALNHSRVAEKHKKTLETPKIGTPQKRGLNSPTSPNLSNYSIRSLRSPKGLSPFMKYKLKMAKNHKKSDLDRSLSERSSRSSKLEKSPKMSVGVPNHFTESRIEGNWNRLRNSGFSSKQNKRAAKGRRGQMKWSRSEARMARGRVQRPKTSGNLGRGLRTNILKSRLNFTIKNL